MTDFSIQVEGVGKQFWIGGSQASYKTFRETLNQVASWPFRLGRKQNARRTSEAFWALKNVSFNIPQGQVVGIIGHNGAGKSTLLKILSEITEPTEGRITIQGRVGSLLEVGTGFHPELTGRENIFLNGAILGMHRTEIASKFDEIVAFAEVDKFVDTPVKHYSSGMYLRLAFAVAAHLEPEILLVDEVLAVGDAAFQRKCLGKMGEVSQQGRTVLFVSHNMPAVQSLCQRVIWLNKGHVYEDGDTNQIVSNYLRASVNAASEQVWENIDQAPGNDKVRIRRACVYPKDATIISVRTDFVLEFEYWNLKPDTQLNLSLLLYNEVGITVLNSVPYTDPNWHGKFFPKGLFRSICEVPGKLLNDGTYRVLLLVVEEQRHVIYRHEDILSFNVQDSVEGRGAWHGTWPGVIRPEFQWTTELLESV